MDKGMKSAFCETGRAPGRLLRNIDNMNESGREEFWIELEAQNFADAIDELRTYIITTK